MISYVKPMSSDWTILRIDFYVVSGKFVERSFESCLARRARRAKRAEWGTHGQTLTCIDKQLIASEVANRFQRMGKYRQICLSKFGLMLWFAFLSLRVIWTDTFVYVGLDCSACFAFSSGIYALQLNGASRSNVRPAFPNPRLLNRPYEASL